MTDNTDTLVLTEAAAKTPIIYKILLGLTLMGVIGGALTAVMTYMNVGYTETFFTDWRKAFFSALTIMPVGIIMMGLLTKLFEKLLPDTHHHKRNLLIGGVMAVIMESILAFSTAASMIGFASKSEFLMGWFDGFIGALPVGLAIMVVMSLTIKPKIEAFMKS